MELNDSESELLATMPRPPAVAMARVSNVWIIEWLPEGEQETGRQLFEWMQRRREGWATYRRCERKGEVLIAIEESEAFVRGTGQVPILHIEAHGAESGIVGPNGRGQLELLAWDDLNEPLQAVNLATGCNLLLYLAACLGYAGVQVFSRGPRAPALAIVGPDRTVWPNEVLEGAKEFYRRLQEGGANLQDILDSASNEMGEANLLYEPVAALTYEAWMGQLIVSLRPAEQTACRERMRLRMQEMGRWGAEEIERRLDLLPVLLEEAELQGLWNRMFMIDLFPENAARFELDMAAARRMLISAHESGR